MSDDREELELAALAVRSRAPWHGRRDTTDAKIRIDMPLPMPRWVMSSPSHITSAVPAVHVRTISAAWPAVKSGMRSLALGSRRSRAGRPCPRAARTRSRSTGSSASADGEVAGPLRDLLLPDLAFLLPLLELRDHDAEQLHDDRRRDVRHDPEEEDRDVGDRAAGEQVEEADDAAVVLGLVLQLLDRARSRRTAPAGGRRAR